MSGDTRYLEKHGDKWRVQVKVPLDVRPILGKARLVRGLGTDSVSKAKLLRHAVVAEFQQMIADARQQLDGQHGSARTTLALEAAEFHAALQEAKRYPLVDADDDADGVMLVHSLIRERTTEISHQRNSTDATIFNSLALGTAVPITQFVEDWLEESVMKLRQKTDYRRAIVRLDRWLEEQQRSTTIASVKPKAAGEYVSRALLARGINRRTVNKDIACLSSYWKWLLKKDHSEVNPWIGQSVSEPSRSQSESQRAFTQAEMVKLFAGDPPPLLRDFMTIAALSGMRIGEIAALQVRDVQAGSFNVRRSKTRAGERVVPIHSGLERLVLRRCEGKAPIDLLFSDLPPYDPTKPQEQASPVTKAFVRYRRKVGVDEVPEGERRSLVDFHSFRRWFVREAASALERGAKGYSEYTLADVVGHAKKGMALGMTMGVYAGASDMAARRACVEAVSILLPQ